MVDVKTITVGNLPIDVYRASDIISSPDSNFMINFRSYDNVNNLKLQIYDFLIRPKDFKVGFCLKIQDPTTKYPSSNNHFAYVSVVNDFISDHMANDSVSFDITNNKSMNEKVVYAFVDSSYTHEATHEYLHRKCKSNLNRSMNEGIARAREMNYLRGKSDVPNQIASKYLADRIYRNNWFIEKKRISLADEKIMNASKQYCAAADKVGDDIALNIARDTMNFPSKSQKRKKVVERFAENVNDYMVAMKHQFSQI